MAGAPPNPDIVDLTECDGSDDDLVFVSSSDARRNQARAHAVNSAQVDQALRTHVEQLRSISSGEDARRRSPTKVDLHETPLDSDSESPSPPALQSSPRPVVPAKPTPLAEAKCPVCLSVPERMCATSCGHMYCSDCVFEALSNGPGATKKMGSCAICRAPVSYSSVLFLEAWGIPKKDAL